MSHTAIRFTLYVAGEEVTHYMPSKMAVCPRCEGIGSHVNPSIDGNGITASEMEELGDDFRDDYMAGVYDVPCYQCHGANVVQVPNIEAASFAVKRAWIQHQREERDYQRDVDSERWLRMAESGERY